MKFTVVRDEWLKGDEEEPGQLESKTTGKKCCLGFFGLAAGVKPEHLPGKYSPSDLGEEDSTKFGKLLIRDSGGEFQETAHCIQIMRVNDSSCKTEYAREVCLQELFKEAGHEIEFVDTKPN